MCKYSLPATEAFEMIYQMTEKAKSIEKMWVSNLLEETFLKKLVSFEENGG